MSDEANDKDETQADDHVHGPDCGHDHEHDHAPAKALDPARYEGIEGHRVDEVSQCKRELLAVVPVEDFDASMAKAAKAMAKEARIPGFRKGKVPVARIHQLFGQELREKTTDEVLQKVWDEVRNSGDFKPVGSPQVTEISAKPGEPMMFAATFEVLPEFEIQGLDTIKVESQVVKVSDADVEEEVEHLRLLNAKTVPSDKDEAGPGDLAQIDMYRFAPGSCQENGEAVDTKEDMMVEVGSEHVPPELDKVLLGLSVGGESNFDMESPEDHPDAALAGQKIPYKVKLKAVMTRELPELDDALAKKVGDFESVDALQTAIKDSLLARRKSEARDLQDKQVVDHLLSCNSFEIPRVLVEEEAEGRMKRAVRDMAQRGMDPGAADVDWPAEFERARQGSEHALRADYILELAARAKDVEASDEAVEAELQVMAESRGSSPSAIRKELVKSNRMNDFKQTVRRRATLEVLKGGATVTVE